MARFAMRPPALLPLVVPHRYSVLPQLLLYMQHTNNTTYNTTGNSPGHPLESEWWHHITRSTRGRRDWRTRCV